jgi:hypothetical protein
MGVSANVFALFMTKNNIFLRRHLHFKLQDVLLYSANLLSGTFLNHNDLF